MNLQRVLAALVATLVATTGWSSIVSAQDGGVADAAVAPADDVVASDVEATGTTDDVDGATEPDEAAAPAPAPVEPIAAAAPPPAAAPAAAPTSTAIPISFALHGNYRARFSWYGNVPLPALGRDRAADAAFAFMRLRLEPSIAYGTDPAAPVAALYFQIDALDNVVFGDNERISSTPLFAETASLTDIDGFTLSDSLRLERAWLEVLVPIGQIRVGRMPSQWGLGILVNDGNGLGEWGDPMYGSTFDRVLFATRPLTIVNALTRGDARPTPLILALAYDKLVEDAPPEDAADRSAIRATPFGFLSNGDDDVQEAIAALIWADPDFHPERASDELFGGMYLINRWQEVTDANVWIMDAFWRLQRALGDSLPSLYTAGELLYITGSSQGLDLGFGCDPDIGDCPEVDASIFGAVARVGLVDRAERWTGTLEVGHNSGDGQIIANRELTVRPFHSDYRVGLLLYRVAVAARTAAGLTDLARPLWSKGGVWNSSYLWPQFRYEILPGIEAHGAFLMAWADELTYEVYVNDRARFGDTSCSLFEGDCFLGWEADLALRVKWGENDLLHWDTEGGLMRAGGALRSDTFGLGEPWLWTVQTRLGMIF